MGKKTTSATKKAKYAAHPAIARANKLRKVKKQARLYPQDLQAKADLQRLGV